MASQRTVNTFQEGMVQDIDKLNQPNSAYRFSKNGKLIFNEDGTYSWENEEGCTPSFRIDPLNALGQKRIPLGWAGGANYFILFSKHDTDNSSEIGIVTVDENGLGTYKTLFNDVDDDPDGNLLNFENEISAVLLPEIDKLIRVYWVDGVKSDSNRPRSFTFEYDDALPKDDVNAYSAVSLSVHNIDLQSEYKLGLIKYRKNTNGGDLESGVYQLTYRLGTADGYRTPWAPLTRTIFLTPDSVDGTNWHNYEMEGVGIPTNKGIEFEIKGIDTRYSSIELAYVYAQSEEAVTSAGIFANQEITSSSMIFRLLGISKATPLSPDEIPQRFSNIERAKTLNIKDNTMYLGNLFEGTLIVDPEPILQNLEVKVVYKYMRDDENTNKDYFSHLSGSPISRDKQAVLPLTHGNPRTGVSKRQLHDGVGGIEEYVIDNDYINYKGTQVDNLYRGYRRGETYRFGIVFYDKLGQPSFVYHLADIKFPELYSNDYTADRVKEDGTVVSLTKVASDQAWISNNFNELSETISDENFVLSGDVVTSGVAHLRIMGIRFDNIDLSTIKDDIVGYQIVRAEPDSSIIAQGLGLPCVREDVYTRIAPAPTQRWRGADSGGTLREPALTDPYDLIFYQDFHMWDKVSSQNDGNGTSRNNYFLRPFYTAFLAPELFFEVDYTINGPGVSPGDSFKVVGSYFAEVQPSYDGTAIGQESAQVHTLYGAPSGVRDIHTMQKLYYTRNNTPPVALSPADNNSIHPCYGESATINYKERLNYGQELEAPFTAQDVDLTLLNNVVLRGDGSGNEAYWGTVQYQGSANSRILYYKTSAYGSKNRTAPTFKAFNATSRSLEVNGGSVGQHNSQYNGYVVLNYVRPNANPYGGLNNVAIQNTIFESTGHFQPVNNDSFSVPDIVSGIKVWGGDTFITYIDVVKVMPDFRELNNLAPFPMGQGVIFPCESRINMALRQRASEQNPSYANNGLRAQKTYEGDSNWDGHPYSGPSGIFYFDNETKLEEEWNYQAALQYTETLQFYAPKPFETIVDDRFPVRWRYSEVKIYGDPIDSFRNYLVNDFRDMDGRYGDIIASEYLFDQIYVLQESGFARLRAYDRALIQSPNLGTLTTGTGDRLQGQDYISTKYGSQHQFSVVNSGKAIYWIDSVQRKFCRFAQNGVELLSDVRGMHQFFDRILTKYPNADEPINGRGIVSGYDYTNNSVYLTFTDVTKHNNTVAPGYEPDINNFTTISFNENLNAFISFHSYVPNMYISHRGFLLSIDTNWPVGNTVADVFYVHENYNRGEFYGVNYDSEIDIITKEGMMYHKTFDNIRMNINDASAELFTTLVMTTENQTEQLDIQNDDRCVLKENIFRVPLRTVDQVGRMRGKHIKNKFIFENRSDITVRFTSLETLFRMSNRL